MTEKQKRTNALSKALIVIVLVFVSVTVFHWGATTGSFWPCVASPGIITLSGLWLMQAIFFFLRRQSYLRRKQRRAEDPAFKLEIPIGTKKPEQFDGVETLHEAQWSYIGNATEAQGRYFALGILVSILPALALFLLSLQLLLMPSGGRWAIGLIVAEIACLLILVYLGLRNHMPTSEWIESRVRTELFRREQYLSLAAVALLLRSPLQVAEEASRRRGEMEGANPDRLIGFVPMQEPSGQTWIEVLHRRGRSRLPARVDLIQRMESYLYFRIEKQLLWFADETYNLKMYDRTWTQLLTGALIAAIAVAALHAFHLQLNEVSILTSKEPSSWRTAIGILAIICHLLARLALVSGQCTTSVAGVGYVSRRRACCMCTRGH